MLVFVWRVRQSRSTFCQLVDKATFFRCAGHARPPVSSRDRARSLPGSFVHVDSKVPKRSSRALGSVSAPTTFLTRSDIAEDPIPFVATGII
jgi:hypothetical protein